MSCFLAPKQPSTATNEHGSQCLYCRILCCRPSYCRLPQCTPVQMPFYKPNPNHYLTSDTWAVRLGRSIKQLGYCILDNLLNDRTNNYCGYRLLDCTASIEDLRSGCNACIFQQQRKDLKYISSSRLRSSFLRRSASLNANSWVSKKTYFVVDWGTGLWTETVSIYINVK
jgi:hypothetical protein